jgi:hypothetical protein
MSNGAMTAAMVTAAMGFNFGVAHATIPPMYQGEWCSLNKYPEDFEICKNMTPEDIAKYTDMAKRHDIPARIVIDAKGMTFKYTNGNERKCKATADIRHDEREYGLGWIVRYDCGELGKRTFRIQRWDTHVSDKNRKGVYLQVVGAPGRYEAMFDRMEHEQQKMDYYKQPKP